MTNSSRFYFYEHQHKGEQYLNALEAAGFERVPPSEADFALLDHESGHFGMGFASELGYFAERRVPIFTYPHTARPGFVYDLHKHWPYTRAKFVHSPGFKEVLESLECPVPIEVVGWPYSEIKPFEKREPGKKLKVLFGPIHPNANGWLCPWYCETNTRMLQLLLNTPDIDLTIRYFHRLEEQGLWHCDKATYVQAEPDGSTKEIEEADVVIGAFTFAYLALAMGKPTIMIGELTRPHAGNKPWNVRWSLNWEKYFENTCFTYNGELYFDQPEKFRKILEQSLDPTDEVINWREKFIGRPFDAGLFVSELCS